MAWYNVTRWIRDFIILFLRGVITRGQPKKVKIPEHMIRLKIGRILAT